MADSRKNAPPHGDVGTTSGTARAMQSHEAGFRSRLGGTGRGVYKTEKDTGGKMPTGRASAPLVLRPGSGAQNSPRRSTPVKT